MVTIIKQYCLDCDEVVDARYIEDNDTGWRGCECCQCGGDDVEDVSNCRICGADIPSSEQYCDECMAALDDDEVKDAFDAFDEVLPVGIDVQDAVRYYCTKY